MNPHIQTVENCFAILRAYNGTAEQLIESADTLVRAGYFEEVRPFIVRLVDFPDVRLEARRLLAVCDQLKRWGVKNDIVPLEASGVSRYSSTLHKGVMVARRPGATKLIFVFTGAAKQVWISIHLLHQLLPADVHIVYLMDHKQCHYLLGIDEFGWGYDAMIGGLQNVVAELGASEVYCIGSSAGGYASMRAGYALGARSMLVLSPATEMNDIDTVAFAARSGRAPEEVSAALPEGTCDLIEMSQQPGASQAVTIAFGGANDSDAQRARRMLGVAGFSLHEVPGYSRHDVLAELIANGDFKILLQKMLNAL